MMYKILMVPTPMARRWRSDLPDLVVKDEHGDPMLFDELPDAKRAVTCMGQVPNRYGGDYQFIISPEPEQPEVVP